MSKITKFSFFGILVSISILNLLPGSASLAETRKDFIDKNKMLKPNSAIAENALKQMPLHFESNLGQIDSSVKFLSHGINSDLFLTSTGASITLKKRISTKNSLKNKIQELSTFNELSENSKMISTETINMKFVGANKNTKISGEELVSKSNYFMGNNSNNWRTEIPNYSRVKYTNIYPGIDMIYYGNSCSLEYDLIVQPGANPEMIAMQFAGKESSSVQIDPQGNLVVCTKQGKICQKKPVIYQDIKGERQFVDGQFILEKNNEVRFKIREYNSLEPLVIDPVVNLTYSTFLGGVDVDFIAAVALDENSNIYITGMSSSGEFPVTSGVVQSKNNGKGDIFVTKLTPDGKKIIYSTFLGGSGSDIVYGIALDKTGSVYLTGETSSTNFPLLKPLPGQDQYNGGLTDAFVSKLDPDGKTLVYSTYLGGNQVSLLNAGDSAHAIAVDVLGNAYIVGGTGANDFPITSNALQSESGGGNDAFITKLNPSGNELVYSTYLGGGFRNSDPRNSLDTAWGIAIDSTGNAYVSGGTNSLDFPITSQNFQSKYAGGSGDIFVSKISDDGKKLLYSTYLGGNQDDGITFQGGNFVLIPTPMVIDVDGNIYVASLTSSENFPLKNPIQSQFGGTQDVFISKLNINTNTLDYSTYIGGNGTDIVRSVAIDSNKNIYLTGVTLSTTFPVVNALQSKNGGSTDAFITKINSAGNAFEYSTYLGGSGNDSGQFIVVDGKGTAFVGGATASSNFPIKDALQGSLAGSTDGFFAKISKSDIALKVDLNSQSIIPGDSATFLIDAQSSNTSVPINLSAKIAPANDEIKVDLIQTLSAIGVAGKLTVTTTAKAPAGAYSILVTATQGQDTVSTNITLNIQSGFALNITPQEQSISPGASTSFNVKADAIGIFNESISLTAKVAPSNENITISTPPSISIGNTAAITVNTKAVIPVGIYVVTLTGTAGSIIRTANVTVKVNAPDFTLKSDVTEQKIEVGKSTAFVISVLSVNGFNDSVGLKAAIPSGNDKINFKLSPDIIKPGENATLSITTTTDTPIGTFPINISAAANDKIFHNLTLMLNVVAPVADFSLELPAPKLTVFRNQKGKITLNIKRVGGFSDKVTVVPTDTTPFKVNLTPASQVSGDNSVVFNFKVKEKAPFGTQNVIFTGKDPSGKSRAVTLELVIAKKPKK